MAIRKAIFGLAFCLLLNLQAWAEVQFTVHYTSREDRIAPRKGEVFSDKTQTFIVTKDHQVKTGYYSGKIASTGSLNLGSAFGGTTVTGLPVVGRARIEGNGIAYALFHESFKMVIRAKIDGKDSCSAEVEYSLLPGHQYFEARLESTGAAVTDTNFTAENVTCEVADLPDLPAFHSAETPNQPTTNIHIQYDEVVTGVAPDSRPQRSHIIRDYELSGNKLRLSAPDLYGQKAVNQLGVDVSGTTKDGRSSTGTFRVLNRVLFAVSDWGGFSTVRKIYTDGKTSCHSTLEYKKKDGAENFEVARPSGSVFYRDMHAENIVCSIRQAR
jgi:hypothetical protein